MPDPLPAALPRGRRMLDRGAPFGAVGLVVALLVLVALVSASGGHAESGVDEQAAVGQLLSGVLFGVVCLILLVGVLSLFIRRKGPVPERKVSPRQRAPWWARALMGISVLGVVLLFRDTISERLLRNHGDDPPAATVPRPLGAVQHHATDTAFFMAGVALVVLVAAVAVWRFHTSVRPPDEEGDLELPAEAAGAVAKALTASLDDVAADPDPRRAVVTAYALLTGVLAGVGLRREKSETASEYLTRALDRLGLSAAAADAASRLTRLFESARYGDSPVDLGARDAAVACLREVRDAAAATSGPRTSMTGAAP